MPFKFYVIWTLYFSLRDYTNRSNHLDDVDQSLVGELTDLEKHLLISQQLMTLRGKV